MLYYLYRKEKPFNNRRIKMVHRGNIMGIRFYGEATEGDIRNLKNFADKLKDLQDALALLFNEDVAEKAIKNTILSQISVQAEVGIEQHTEELEELYRMGILQKTESRKQKDNMHYIPAGRMLLH